MLPSAGGIVPQRLLPYERELEANVTLERLVLYVSEMDKRPSIPDYWGVLPQVFIRGFAFVHTQLCKLDSHSKL